MALIDSILRALIQLVCGQQKPQKQDNIDYPGAQQPSHPPPAQYKPPHQQHPPQHPPQQYPQQPHQQPYQQQPSYPSPPGQHGSGRPPRPIHQRVDENQANQHDPQYLDLRKRAGQAGDAMGHAFDESKRAYESGDGARAKQLSEEGKRHKQEMEDLNRQASDWIYHANNTDSGPNVVDLHGLYVKEAITRTEQAIQAAKQRGDPNVHLIVGKGLHSQGQVAKLKPAIEELMVKYNLAAQLDPHNSGVLIVQLDQRGERGMGVDEIQRRLEKDGDQCIIM